MTAGSKPSESSSHFSFPLTSLQKRSFCGSLLHKLKVSAEELLRATWTLPTLRISGMATRIADQIKEVFEPCELSLTPASNDRIGGWQLMYQMLQTGQWKIADTCQKLVEAIPSRMP